LVPELDGPIYKGIFSDICLLVSASNFPIMIDLAQVAWFNLTLTTNNLCFGIVKCAHSCCTMNTVIHLIAFVGNRSIYVDDAYGESPDFLENLEFRIFNGNL
jgi:hypothetical protein